MKNTIGLVGKSLAERFFSVLLTCAVTALALYLFDEAWTEYRYQIRSSTQNVDTMREDPYCVLKFSPMETAGMSEAELLEIVYQWIKDLNETEEFVKFAGTSMQCNFLFEELKEDPDIREKQAQYWTGVLGPMEDTYLKPMEQRIAGIAMEQELMDMQNVQLSESMEIAQGEEAVYPVYFGSSWKGYVELGQILTSEEFFSDRDIHFQVAGFLKDGTESMDPSGGVSMSSLHMDEQVIAVIPKDTQTGNEGRANFILLNSREDMDAVRKILQQKMRDAGIFGKIENLGELREEQLQSSKEVFGLRFRFAIFVVTVAFLFSAVVFVSNLLSRKREIGILYTCGFGQKRILAMVLMEHAAVLLAAFLIAYWIRCIQILTSNPFDTEYARMEWQRLMEREHTGILPGMFLLALLVWSLASILPYVMIRKMSPVTMLEEGKR